MIQGLSEEEIRSKYIRLKEEYSHKISNPNIKAFKHICGVITWSESEPDACVCQNPPTEKVLHVCFNGHATFLEKNVLTFRFNCMKCSEIEMLDLPQDVERSAENRKNFYEERYGIPKNEPINPDIRRSPEFVSQRNQAELFANTIAKAVAKELKEILKK